MNPIRWLARTLPLDNWLDKLVLRIANLLPEVSEAEMELITYKALRDNGVSHDDAMKMEQEICAGEEAERRHVDYGS